ncbi:hypothetical protein K435DRAFT_856525 [Dendrothele bispora CBS 962.96]|uniref:Uncharacterized protein n=1 Tax=Dendrothele bispora (strain CBS 962.96) TaxID=1314807 RepID=A0A4S8M9F2_DENBC|nr:hypothetical protein K435DRAFT_856525 [Dendrothele bispora CBS 962.96]
MSCPQKLPKTTKVKLPIHLKFSPSSISFPIPPDGPEKERPKKSSDGMVNSFDAELEKVTFLRRPYAALPTSRKSLAHTTASPSTPPNKCLKFSYTDTTPTPATKRKADALESSP